MGMITTNDDLGGGIKLLQGNTAYVSSKTWRGRDFGVVERAGLWSRRFQQKTGRERNFGVEGVLGCQQFLIDRINFQ